MTTKTLSQTTKLVIYRSGNVYIFGRWVNDVRQHEQVISQNEARRIINAHPAGGTEDSRRVDFTYSACYWKWEARTEK